MDAKRKSFHIALQAFPEGETAEAEVRFEGRAVTTLVIPPTSLHAPLTISFEDAVGQLTALPRMFVEPDGSFVWVSDASESSSWQLDGVLCDRGEKLQYVELRGTCSRNAFDLIATIFRPGSARLAVQLVEQAMILREEEFQRLIW